MWKQASSRDPGRWTWQTFGSYFPERDPEDQRSGCLFQISESRDKYSGGVCPSPAQGQGSRCREIHPSKERGLFQGLGILAFVSQSTMGTQMAKDMDGWSGRSRI